MTVGSSDALLEFDAGISFRSRLSAGNDLAGTFVKTTSHQVIEVLGSCGLDFVVIDAEHAPFGRGSLDVCCMAARASALPALIRTSGARREDLLQALDVAAIGVLVPHVDTPEIAAQVVCASRYREAGGERGFSNSPRAGSYGQRPMRTHIQRSDQAVTVVVQIETAAAVEAVEQIARVEGVDGLFIGRADLAVSYQVDDLVHPTVQQAVERICRAGQAQGRAVGMFLPDASGVDTFRVLGVSFFVIGSDQSMLRSAAADTARGFRSG
ncbi:HpcH/HpaI aldolase [Pusillimonas sp. T7-7]|uniref:HpcH/HpaI aldolase family protein n=1 Tax=Pusillimonas sp. (strain T7-7) TaxID=1007105 RepID=UPI0002084536|nr:aldolase/citrate lyase family protein [Pusillimonas sp. T7-7]AEC22105.1 HpcH/HpaI aldolase [Pusillimonas sp. T7-7]